MGTVYLARDPQLARTLAIKVLLVDSGHDELRERFAREARSAAALRHPNIVTIYDVGEQAGQPFIAMEYVNGESVAEMIRRRAPIALERKLELIQELYEGLAYAHKSGIIHRDIKPSNLMVTADGDLKILDFGLARLKGAADSGLTQTGFIIGTPYYMSPEQIEGRLIDQRSDIFAAGLVMYELLTYQKAFSADVPWAVLRQDRLHRRAVHPGAPSGHRCRYRANRHDRDAKRSGSSLPECGTDFAGSSTGQGSTRQPHRRLNGDHCATAPRRLVGAAADPGTLRSRCVDPPEITPDSGTSGGRTEARRYP